MIYSFNQKQPLICHIMIYSFKITHTSIFFAYFAVLCMTCWVVFFTLRCCWKAMQISMSRWAAAFLLLVAPCRRRHQCEVWMHFVGLKCVKLMLQILHLRVHSMYYVDFLSMMFLLVSSQSRNASQNLSRFGKGGPSFIYTFEIRNVYVHYSF